MSTYVSDIKTGIESRIETTVPSYTKLSYQTDISKNKFKGNQKRYAVLPKSLNQVEGLLGSTTLDHTYEITLVDSYNNGAKSQIGDELKVSRISKLTDDILTIYQDLQVNKRSIESSILIINDLSIDEAEFDESEKIISITCSINVKYKINT